MMNYTGSVNASSVLRNARGNAARNKEERIAQMEAEISDLVNDKAYAQGRVTELWGLLRYHR